MEQKRATLEPHCERRLSTSGECASVRERRSFRTKRAEKAGAVEGERRGFKTRAPIGFEGRVVPSHSQPCASRASWLPPPSCRAAQQPCAPTVRNYHEHEEVVAFFGD